MLEKEMKPVYWRCAQCRNVGVVYQWSDNDVYDVVGKIKDDHQDASDNACALDLLNLSVRKTPYARNHREKTG